ncbi:MAG: phosphoenolpyruvate synthase, partial [Dehalococcoidia bacterium]
ISSAIERAYQGMGGPLVAVRSSATVEDLAEASFAGQLRTFLNVQGTCRVIDAVRACWASLFEPRAIFYMAQQSVNPTKARVAVAVQKMVQSEASGTMFTVEPVSGDTTQVCIEAVYGLGEAIVSGELTPDRYLVDKRSMTILEKQVVRQDWKLVGNLGEDGGEANIKVSIPPDIGETQVIDDAEIIVLTEMGKRIEEHYGFPQDVEWARENGRLYVVQSRPVTTIGPAAEPDVKPEAVDVPSAPLLSGFSASPGVGSGPIAFIQDTSQLDKIKSGDVLLASMTTPDFVPAMKRAAAIVTDRGGRTCHAAIVSRELGVPCVVGTEVATRTLVDGQIVTVDGTRGVVYDGRLTLDTAQVHYSRAGYKTHTRIYVNLAQPHLAERVAQRHVDGVGLLRAEFMVGEIGEHPRYVLSRNRGWEFVEKLAQGMIIFTKAFYPRPVVYRTTDFKTNEYRKNLKGGEAYEMEEENPMLGYRGASRYISDLDAFRLEIEAIKRVRAEYDNLWVMLPFVRTVNELGRVKKILEEEGLRRCDSFKLWMMVEVPSNVILLDKFIDVGLDGISIGSNDLTQLILGVDRDNERFRDTFDERNEAILWALERAISIAGSRGVTSSICGQAPSDYPELAEKLIEWGITSVSINPDVIDRTR